jgi:signal transduction histidine kinase
LAERAQSGGIKLETAFEKADYTMMADERRLKQIGLNLITNAIKFTQPGGVITVSLGRENESIMLKVADTGVGMRPEDIPQALSPFQQIKNNMIRTTEGTGLGLPLTKDLVELHNGTLQIESSIGKGTTVFVKLPALQRLSA